jgi:peptidase M28-like protein
VFDRLLEAVRLRTSGERALADIVELTHFHRIQASPGYDAAADWLERKLVEAGLAPERVWAAADGRTRYGGFPMPEGWRCGHARATLHGGRGAEPLADFEAAPLSIVQRSDRARGRFPLVSIGSFAELDRVDVRGKAVLCSEHAQRAHERVVVTAGAAGLVCDGRRLLPPVRTEEHDRDSLAYTSFWWLEDRPRGWGIVVSPARGRELRDRLAAGERLEVEVDFDCDRFAGRIPLTTAVIPGELPGEVLVTSHLCHPRPGANDNASGSAATLECARVLAALAASGAWRSPRRTVRFLWMPEFTGTYAWHALRPDSTRATIAALNLDMVGERQDDCGSTLRLERAPHFLGSFADELLARILGEARLVIHAGADAVRGEKPRLAAVMESDYSGGSDHALWLDPAVGVPCPMLIQWPDRYYHSDLDTPERCDPGSLALAAAAAATYAAFLAEAGAEEAGWLGDAIAAGARSRMLAALDGDRPAEAAHAELERAERALASVARLAAGHAADHPTARAIARALPLAEEQLVGIWDSEIRDELPARAAVRASGSSRVPVRRVDGLYCPMRWLAPGWEALGRERQQRLLALEGAIPGGTTALDVAWFATDGARDVSAITAHVAREGCPVSGAQLDEWFDFAVALGFTGWR